MTQSRFLKIGIGLASSILFAWLAFRAIDIVQVGEAIASARAWPILGGVAAFVAGYSCRIARWRAMLQTDGAVVGFRSAGIAFMVSIAANNVLPLRAGDVMRAFMFSSWLGVPSSTALATLISERLLDLLFLLLALGAALHYLGLSSDTAGALLGVGSVGLFAIGIAVALVLVFPQVFQPVALFVLRKIQVLLGQTGARLVDAVDKLFTTLKNTMRNGRGPKLLVLSGFAWGFEALVFYCAALSIPNFIDPQAAWLAMPVGTLSTLLPSSPGYFGTFHYFVIQASEYLGNEPVAAATFAVLVHAILWLTATAIGGACLAVWSLKKAKT